MTWIGEQYGPNMGELPGSRRPSAGTDEPTPRRLLLTVGEAAEQLTISRTEMWRMIRRGCIGWSARAAYDRSVRRWRHLDLVSSRPFLVAQVRRLACRRCRRVRTETVPWARPGARHTRDFEDVVAWLAQRTDKTTIARPLRCSWEAEMVVGDGKARPRSRRW